MKKHTLYLLLVISNLTILNANDSTKIEIKALCSNLEIGEFGIKINSNNLNLTEDAMQDNLGGYVDIPATKYYLKTKNALYYLDGVVEHNYKNSINQFISSINKDSKKLITPKKLYSLKNSMDLKFIQKIDLEKNNKIGSSKTTTTTNILNIYFDENIFEKEYHKCKK